MPDGNSDQQGIGVPRPDRHLRGMSHEELKAWTDAAEPAVSEDVADQWGSMGAGLSEAGKRLQQAVAGSEAGWTGLVADAMRYRLEQVAQWSQDAGEGFSAASSVVRQQSSAVGEAKARMPEPVPYDPVQIFEDAGKAGLSGILALPQRLYAQKQKSDAAYSEALVTVAARDGHLRQGAGVIPAFTTPPALNDDGGGRPPVVPPPEPGGPRPGGGPVFPGPGPSGPRPGDGPGPTGGTPGQSGPSGPAQGGPGQPGPGVTVPGSHTPVPVVPGPVGETGSGPGLPGGTPGGPGFGPGGGFVPGGGPGRGAPGGGGEAGGAARGRGAGPFPGGPEEPGRGAGRGLGGGARFGAGGVTAAEAAAGRGVAGARGGGAGLGGVPLGAGTGKGDEDTEHQRPAWLVEDDPESLFGSDELTAPAVLGVDEDEE